MDPLIELAYVGVEVADRSQFGRYLSEVIGLVPGAPAGQAHTWRMDRKAHRLLVHEGPSNDLHYLGFEAAHQTAYDRAVARLAATGVAVTEGSEEDKRARRVRDLAWAMAPWGRRIEIVTRLADAETAFDSALVPGGFVTDSVGMGHAVLMFPAAAPDGAAAFARAAAFLEQGLGMVLSDRIEAEHLGSSVYGSFYHCNPRHHSLALLGLPAPALPGVLHHLMVESASEDNVGRAYDRARAARAPIAMGLGKHANDQMFSFYSVTPAAFQMEFGCRGVIVGDDWPARVYDRVSAWGHHPEPHGSATST